MTDESHDALTTADQPRLQPKVSSSQSLYCGSDIHLTNHLSAHLHFSETTLAMTIWSARDIEEGEEITISCETSFSLPASF